MSGFRSVYKFVMPCSGLLTLLFLAPTAIAGQVLYCKTERAIGLVRKEGVWTKAEFETARHTITFNDDFTELRGLKPFGDDEEKNKKYPYRCTVPYADVPAGAHMIVCKQTYENGVTFIFNKKKSRFTFTQPSIDGGYAYDPEEPLLGSDVLEVGTCQDS